MVSFLWTAFPIMKLQTELKIWSGSWEPKKHKDTARRSRNQSPHPALRATFSQREKDTPAECPSPSGRGCREAAGEGSKNFVQKTRSNILVTKRGRAATKENLPQRRREFSVGAVYDRPRSRIEDSGRS